MNPTRDHQMLNIAAAEYRLQRTALQDCVTILRAVKERDEASPSGKTLRRKRGEPYALALDNAEQLLKPRHEAHPLGSVREKS